MSASCTLSRAQNASHAPPPPSLASPAAPHTRLDPPPAFFAGLPAHDELSDLNDEDHLASRPLFQPRQPDVRGLLNYRQLPSATVSNERCAVPLNASSLAMQHSAPTHSVDAQISRGVSNSAVARETPPGYKRKAAPSSSSIALVPSLLNHPRAQQRDASLARAAQLGLLTPVGEAVTLRWDATPTPAEKQLADQHEANFTTSALFASMRSDGRLSAALSWYAIFRQVMPDLTGLVPLTGANSVDAIARNRMWRGVFTDFIKSRPSLKRGKHDSVDEATASAYAGTICLLRSLVTGYDLMGENTDLAGPRAAKVMRMSGAPAGDRVISRGVRASDMRKAAHTFNINQADDLADWACALLMHNIIGRGADAGVVKQGDAPDFERDLTLAAFDWHPRDTPGCAIANICPSKDADARHKRQPVPIARRNAQAMPCVDPLDTYDHVLRHWRRRAASTAPHLHATTMLFVHADGSPFTSKDVKRIGQRIARAAGWPEQDVKQVGAKWARIGGATDLRIAFGVTEASALLKRRGRWGSDIGEIYARTSVEEQAQVSIRIGDAQGADLERLCAGWAQPARR